MCFSAEASFAVGSVLIPAGGYCVWAALRKRPSFLGLALVPVGFGIQQISEGFVWQALNTGDPAQARPPALVFLFFALAFWPFWFPLLATLMEPERKRRWLLAGFSLLATGWFWALYYPLLADPYLLQGIERAHHSIQYHYPDLAIYQYIAPGHLRIFYFLSVALPMLLSTQTWARLPGMVLGASALLAALVFYHAFVSVWCFFAAVMALYCCWVFYHLPGHASAPSTAERVSLRLGE